MRIPNRGDIRKILVLNVDGMGDLILASPLMQSLRTHFPKSEISYLVKAPPLQRVLEGYSIVDQYFFMPRSENFFRDTFRLFWALRKKKFDLVIAKTETDRIKGPLLSFFIGAKYRVGEVSPQLGEFGFLYNIPVRLNLSQHQVESNADLFHAVTGRAASKTLMFKVTEVEKEEADKLFLNLGLRPDQSFLAVHPGCRSLEKFKRWPLDRFFEVIAHLSKKHGIPSVIVGGPDELELIPKVEKAGIPHAIGRLTLGGTAALLQNAALFLGNNSGLSHLAAVFGTPTVSFIPRYRNGRSCPYGVRKKDILSESDPRRRAYDFSTVKTERVIEAVDRFIEDSYT